MFRTVSALVALVLLSALSASAGTLVFDFAGGNNGSFSAAEPLATSPWTFSGTDWQVAAGYSINRTLLSPTLVANGDPVAVTFSHITNFESGWDGGILAWQINGSPSTQVTNFSQGGYNDPSIVAFFPSAGSNAPGFSGNASFQSVANLGVLPAGTQFVLRFEAAWDGSVILATPNWRITNLTVSGVEASEAPIPEPGTVGMLLVGGLAMLVGWNRSRG